MICLFRSLVNKSIQKAFDFDESTANEKKTVHLLLLQNTLVKPELEIFFMKKNIKFQLSCQVFKLDESIYNEIGVILEKPATKAELQYEMDQYIIEHDLSEKGSISVCLFSIHKGCFTIPFQRNVFIENEKASHHEVKKDVADENEKASHHESKKGDLATALTSLFVQRSKKKQTVHLLRVRNTVMCEEFESFLKEQYMKIDVGSELFQGDNYSYFEVGVILKNSVSKDELQSEMNKYLVQINNVDEYIQVYPFYTYEAKFKPAFMNDAIESMHNTELTDEKEVEDNEKKSTAANEVEENKDEEVSVIVVAAEADEVEENKDEELTVTDVE